MTQKTLAITFFIFSFAVILSAWGFELIGGYQPCGLCLQQRIPYYIAVPLAALLVAACYKNILERFIRLGFLFGFIIFLASTFLAVRHMGVEWGWWLGPSNCSVGDLSVLENGGSLLEALKDTKIAYCDEAAVRFLGLSFAGWNAVASLLLMGIVAAGFFKRT